VVLLECRAGIERYRSLLSQYPGFAETHFRLAWLLEQKEARDEAYEHYAARDRDGYPARALSAFQDVYRDVAGRHDCALIDTQSYFHEIGRYGLLGRLAVSGSDGLSLAGQIALAESMLQARARRRSKLGEPAQ
jgi:hypothetical protein